MLKRIGLGVVALLLIAGAGAAVVLVRAHLAVRRETAPLPALEAIAAVSGVGALVDDAPVRLSVINTASQAMPRSSVLDSGSDPHGDQPYVMSHPSFVLEWKDGRLLLVDAGMTPAAAVAFGKPLEWLGAAEPMRPHHSAADALGDAAPRVKGIVFTHLHTDHVGGITDLCKRLNTLRVPMTEAQAERTNYTTRPGRDLLEEADCVHLERVNGGPLFPVPGFPGVFLIDAGGHTPGSQIVLAFVHGADGAAHRYAFTGDIVNNVDGINYNISKPLLYRTLVVPESEPRQAELRTFLKRLHDDAGFALLVAHDQHNTEANGVPAWGDNLTGTQ
jgi:glyoxylase-like metal-dependent hydrolase (beta-lactamase superfamily II)